MIVRLFFSVLNCCVDLHKRQKVFTFDDIFGALKLDAMCIKDILKFLESVGIIKRVDDKFRLLEMLDCCDVVNLFDKICSIVNENLIEKPSIPIEDFFGKRCLDVAVRMIIELIRNTKFCSIDSINRIINNII